LTNNNNKQAGRLGRPPKSGTVRAARLTLRVEQWVRDIIAADARAGESQADTVTRWAGERAS